MRLAYGVFIPAFNAARTLHDALESVLAQTVRPTSIVVVDDGSTDATAAVVRSYAAPVRLIRQENLGPGAATDRGIAALSEPLVAGLDADDVWFPEKAARQIAELESDPSLSGVCCQGTVFQHDACPSPLGPPRPLWGRSALMMRRADVARVGAVENGVRLPTGELVDWVARARELGLRFHLLPIVLVGRRRIEGSLTYGQDPSALLPVVRAALERKRAVATATTAEPGSV